MSQEWTKLTAQFNKWKTCLISDPNILGGETVFPNSRLSVRRVGTILERGESPEAIKEDYPYLSDEDLKFAQRYLKDLDPWTQSLIGVISSESDDPTDAYVDYLEEKYR